ncbi:unnamed protein product [Penicillium manginii]
MTGSRQTVKNAILARPTGRRSGKRELTQGLDVLHALIRLQKSGEMTRMVLVDTSTSWKGSVMDPFSHASKGHSGQQGNSTVSDRTAYCNS